MIDTHGWRIVVSMLWLAGSLFFVTGAIINLWLETRK